MKCPRCGGANGPGAQYCGPCGRSLPNEKQATPREQAAKPSRPPTPASPTSSSRPTVFPPKPTHSGPGAGALTGPWRGPAPAPLGKRVAAGTADLLVLFALLGLTGTFTLTDPSPGLALFGFWIYKAVFESGKAQATWGGQRFGIKVVGMHGERLSLRLASIRYVAWIFSTLVFMLGHAVALFTPGRQALHDVLCATVVVPADYTPPPGVDSLPGKTIVERLQEVAKSLDKPVGEPPPGA